MTTTHVRYPIYVRFYCTMNQNKPSHCN